MKALVEIGYAGYVGQEFIPTRDPYQGLREAVALCTTICESFVGLRKFSERLAVDRFNSFNPFNALVAALSRWDV